MSTTIALYPGSFDPVTNGHLDIVTRAARIFDRLVVGIYNIPAKQLMFNTTERVRLFRAAVKDLPNVQVEKFDGLTVEYAKNIGASVIVRGLRAGADFDYEFEMAMMNKYLAPDIELVCLMSSFRYQFLSSSLLKEVAGLGGHVESLVPKPTGEALRKKFGQGKI